MNEFSSKFLHPEEMHKFFLKNQYLASKCLADDVLEKFKNTGMYIPHAGSLYLGVYLEHALVAICRFEHYINNPPTATIHQYIDENYRHLKKIIPNFVLLELGKIANYDTFLTIVPKDARHVHKYCKEMNYKKVGYIKNHMVWRGVLNDVTIYKVVGGE